MGQPSRGCQKGNSPRLHQLPNILLIRHPMHLSRLQQGKKSPSHYHCYSSLLISGYHIPQLGDFCIPRRTSVFGILHPHDTASCRVREPCCLHLVLLATLCGDRMQVVLSPRGMALGQEAEHVGRNFRHPQTKEQVAQRRILGMNGAEKVSGVGNLPCPLETGKSL